MRNKDPETVLDKINSVAAEKLFEHLTEAASGAIEPTSNGSKIQRKRSNTTKSGSPTPAKKELNNTKGKSEVQHEFDSMFAEWNAMDFAPRDFTTEVHANSLEAGIGYSSLFRQMEKALLREVAYYRSEKGGSLPAEEAWSHAFAACKDEESVKRKFSRLMSESVEDLQFVDMLEVHVAAPRVAERLWERVKLQARAEFESGHLAANAVLPAGDMKRPWKVASFIGTRESFVEYWQPSGGIEYALVDMLAQSYFQWQHWLEQSVKRSQTPERHECSEYTKWKAMQREYDPKRRKEEGGSEGEWWRPYLSEKLAIEHAAQEAERWNRVFTRTLRQLRDLRRYTLLTIGKVNQVNIATEGGKQINIVNDEE